MRPESLPTGTVTFLFTDIEGSTRLLRELGEAYAALLDDHNRLLLAAVHDQETVATALAEGRAMSAERAPEYALEWMAATVRGG